MEKIGVMTIRKTGTKAEWEYLDRNGHRHNGTARTMSEAVRDAEIFSGEVETIECPECAGHGYERPLGAVCLTCNGHGEIPNGQFIGSTIKERSKQ